MILKIFSVQINQKIAFYKRLCRKFNRIIKIFLNKENIKVDLIVKKKCKIYSFENELSHVF